MKNYNRNLSAIAKSKALRNSLLFTKDGAYRDFRPSGPASARRRNRFLGLALIVSLLVMSTPAAPQVIVAMAKESTMTARSESIETRTIVGATNDRALADSSTSLFVPSSRSANYNPALMPQGGSPVTYSSAGTSTWTAPTGVTSATVETWGGGGGAGGGLAGGASGGGGGGGYSKSTLSVTGGTGYTVVVGSGGAAGNPNDFNAAGGNGGDSTFNSTSVVAKGGTGGERGAAGGGGAGGAASSGTGTTKYSGGNGAAHPDPYYDSGGGGSSAGTAANGNNASGHTGGSAPTGGGAGGKGGAWNGSGTDGAVAGSAPGGGGGGDIVLTANGVSGAAGAPGKVVITYSSGPSGGSTVGWINCQQSYGASGDGSTDDTSAVNACLTAGAGKVVYLPQGTYIVNNLDSPAAGTVVQGDGQGITILKRKSNQPTLDAPVIKLVNGRVTLRDFTIDGNCVVSGSGTCSNQSTGVYSELLPDGDDIIIDNLEFKNSQQVAIFNVSSGLKVRNSKFIGFGHATNGPAFGIQTHGTYSGSITVEGSYFTNYRLNAIIINGVGVDPETATLLSNNTFVGNHWSTYGGQVCIAGRTILKGNRFYPGANPQTTATAIELASTNGTIVSNNYLAGGGTYNWGIILQDDTHSIVEGNYVKGFSIGMAFTSGTDYVIARNNDFSQNTTPLSNASTGTHNAINSLIAEVGKGGDVASAGTITPSGTTFTITGTTTISTISTANITAGTMIRMITASGLTFDEAGNIDVTGATSLVTSSGSLVFAVWDGTKWRLR